MKVFAALILISLVVSLLIFALPVKAEESLNLTIKPDGSVEPETNLLERNGTVYTFKGDIFGTITVQTDGITIDGAGHTLQGRKSVYERGIYLVGPDTSQPSCRDILVKNLRIYNFCEGIFVVGRSNNSLIGNYLDNSGIHLIGGPNYIGDLIKHNTFSNQQIVIFVDYNRGGSDVITENNFFNGNIFVDLSDAPIVDKNYWSNYTAKYPDAKELDSSGVWDTPYVNDNLGGTNTSIDYHPLVNPVTDFEIQAFSNPNSTPTPSPPETPTASPTKQPETTQPTEIYLIAAAAIAVIFVTVVAAVLLHKRNQTNSFFSF